MIAPPAAGEPGPPDEPSRLELERLEKVLASGKWRLLGTRLIRAIVPMLLFMGVAMSGLIGGVSLHRLVWILLIPFAGGLLVASTLLLLRIWPVYVQRAAAIRGGASYAQPLELKDYYVCLCISLVFIAAAAFLLGENISSAGSVFLFIGAVVTLFWSLGKAIVGYRRASPAHLRRPELLRCIFLSVFLLFVYAFTTLLITKLPDIIQWYLNRNAVSRPAKKLRYRGG